MRCYWHVASVVALASALTLSASRGAFAQTPAEFEGTQISGWTFTPGVIVSTIFDNNVALAAEFPTRPETQGDQLLLIEPFGQFEFHGPRTTFESSYRGYLRRYMDLDELNGFDQRGQVSIRHRATRHLTLFLNNAYMKVPTTDELELNGVLFARTGSRTNTLGGGMESRLSKYMDLNVRYDLTWVDFKRVNTLLRSGFTNGVRAELARRLSDRSALGAEYAIRFATLDAGSRNLTFQDVGATFRYDTGPHTSLDAAAGVSHLIDQSTNITHTGPYVRIGITHQMERATVGASFSRSLLPTFGFGGSSQSEAFHGFVRMPITRNRMYVQQSVSWRRSNPLDPTILALDSWWLRSTMGYAVSRWVRLEGFYAYTRQDSRVPGGLVNRQRVGVQFVFAQPMRIQ
ncbi:MAG: hypothetical protein DMF84_04320 [Acidobacteria bacterium]|nr:MAG: hypothetical protein DMF84_04320 [Acidobacteriota bacterium]